MLFCLGYNAVSWSLSNEAFFYAWFPLLRRKGASASVAAAIATYLVAAYVSGLQPIVAGCFPNIEYFCPVIRIAEFCAGILAAQSFSVESRLKNATLWEVAALAALLFQVSFQQVHYSLGQLSYLFIFTGMVWIFAHQQGAISKWLASQSILVSLGEASFSLYMWRHMVMTAGNAHLPSGMWSLAAVFLAVGTSIVISVLSFRWFEDPVRRDLSWVLLNPQAGGSNQTERDQYHDPIALDAPHDESAATLPPFSEAA